MKLKKKFYYLNQNPDKLKSRMIFFKLPGLKKYLFLTTKTQSIVLIIKI